MAINLIANLDNRNGIGYQRGLLTRIPEDMKWFRQTTEGHIVVLGRITYEEIGKPLPKRDNIIISRDKEYDPHEDALVVHSPYYILNNVKHEDFEVFILGGQSLFEFFMPHAQRLYITRTFETYTADRHFPHISENEFELTTRIPAIEKRADDPDYQFEIYERR